MKVKIKQIVAENPGISVIDLANRSPIDLHDMHVNSRDVGMNPLAPLDDLEAALGHFSLYVSPLKLTVDMAKRSAVVLQVGFHVYDSFDFNGDQFFGLGYWREDGNAISRGIAPPPGSDRVANEDFRIWRRDNAHGGDFAIYSDILPFELTSPITIDLTA